MSASSGSHYSLKQPIIFRIEIGHIPKGILSSHGHKKSLPVPPAARHANVAPSAVIHRRGDRRGIEMEFCPSDEARVFALAANLQHLCYIHR